ncbi:MAG: hypothetical protein H0W50_08350 [Parachlamydiaceae bacterium]|nr:hypothetical protein [Parachlamydiaceae bacterium]
MFQISTSLSTSSEFRNLTSNATEIIKLNKEILKREFTPILIRATEEAMIDLERPHIKCFISPISKMTLAMTGMLITSPLIVATAAIGAVRGRIFLGEEGLFYGAHLGADYGSLGCLHRFFRAEQEFEDIKHKRKMRT